MDCLFQAPLAMSSLNRKLEWVVCPPSGIVWPWDQTSSAALNCRQIFFFFNHLMHLGRRQLENKLLKISYFATGKQKGWVKRSGSQSPTVMLLVGQQGDFDLLGPVLKQSTRRRRMIKWAFIIVFKTIHWEWFFYYLAGKIYYHTVWGCIY